MFGIRSTKVSTFQQDSPGYLIAPLIIVAITLPLWWLRTALTPANTSLVYILVTLVIALRLGTGPSLLAAFTSFFCSEFFLLEPLYSFKVADPREFLDVLVSLLVAILASQMAAYARRQANIARRHADEHRSSTT